MKKNNVAQIMKAMNEEPGGILKKLDSDYLGNNITEYWYEKGSTRYSMKVPTAKHLMKKGYKFF